MDYFDETNEVITKDMVTNCTRDTTYMYAKHKTSTYIDAINNKRSYCGMVNKATRNRNFNTKITEGIGKDGKSRVYYYKTVRSINAGEKIGTKYSSDGRYWSNRVNVASANNLALSMMLIADLILEIKSMMVKLLRIQNLT
jgi:hypothetical protein